MLTLRETNISKLSSETFDVLIVGGGINGAVSAAALAKKGVKVALIDKKDFASETSSNSSNLAWGGIKYLENHDYFPEKCNVTLAKVISRKLIRIKVWERGAGLTKACGTAACATVVAANINGLVDKKTDIEFELGKLSISIDQNNSIHMKGPVSDIKNIEINI